MTHKQNNKIDFQIIKRIMPFVKPYRGYLWLSILCDFIGTSCTAFIPFMVGLAIDQIVGVNQVNFYMLHMILVAFLVVVVVSAVFNWFSVVFENRLSYGTAKAIREAMFDKILKMPFSSLDKVSRGDLLARIVNDIENLTDGLLEGLTIVLSGIYTIIISIVFMMIINPIIATIVIVLTPISLLFAFYLAKRSKKYYTAHANEIGEMGSYVEEMFGNQKVIKAFSYEDRALAKFDEINEKTRLSGEKAHYYGTLSMPATRFINGTIYSIVGFVGAMFAIGGTITIGSISSFLSYSNKFAGPFSEISNVISDLQTAFASGVRLFQIFDQPNERDDSALPELKDCTGDMHIQKICFSYNPNQKLIENFNLEVKNGQRIAIVGPTGCGKTTFINLLMRFYDLNSGRICIDYTDITSVKRSSLRSQFGMVLQDTWLFHGTVKENIAFGKPNATEEEIIKASKMSGAHYFIERLENGYNTIINESGDNISQGQKQLICITRIMLLKPKLLILDEATSNIDTRAELYIQKAFDNLMKNKTSFVVAHRLSTIVNSDVILCMRDGNIVEQGTHKELLEKQGFYYNLYNSQFSSGLSIDDATKNFKKA